MEILETPDFLNKETDPVGLLFIIRISSLKKSKAETPRFQWRGLFIDFARNIWKYPPYDRFVFQVRIHRTLTDTSSDSLPY